MNLYIGCEIIDVVGGALNTVSRAQERECYYEGTKYAHKTSGELTRRALYDIADVGFF